MRQYPIIYTRYQAKTMFPDESGVLHNPIDEVFVKFVGDRDGNFREWIGFPTQRDAEDFVCRVFMMRRRGGGDGMRASA